MSDLSQKSAEARATMQKQNPSVTPEVPAAARNRIPLSVPTRKLEVPEIPGYKLRWFRGTPQRLAQAERAGFEWVSPEEVSLNSVLLGGDAAKSGNTDMGSRVSVIEGGEVDGSGQAVRMYLMKQKLEYYHEDRAINQQRNDAVVDALSAGLDKGIVGGKTPEETAADVNARYVDRTRTKIPDLFRRKTAR